MGGAGGSGAMRSLESFRTTNEFLKMDLIMDMQINVKYWEAGTFDPASGDVLAADLKEQVARMARALLSKATGEKPVKAVCPASCEKAWIECADHFKSCDTCSHELNSEDSARKKTPLYGNGNCIVGCKLTAA